MRRPEHDSAYFFAIGKMSQLATRKDNHFTSRVE